MTSMVIVSPNAVRRAAEAGMCIAEAADFAGCSVSTFKRRIRSDPTIKAVWQAGLAVAEHRQRRVMRCPKRGERRLLVSLKKDLALKIVNEARRNGSPCHSVIVQALNRVYAEVVAT